MILLLEGRAVHYKDPQFSAVKALEFIRRKMPYKLVESLDDSNVDSFLGGWKDNRVRVLFFATVDVIRLRYLTTAFRFRNRAVFGYIRLHDPKSAGVLKRFGLSQTSQMDTMMVFQENADTPVATASAKDLSLSSMSEMLEANQFLQLPRLSSQVRRDKYIIGNNLGTPTVDR
jgi:DnaJ family protein C protein 16